MHCPRTDGDNQLAMMLCYEPMACTYETSFLGVQASGRGIWFFLFPHFTGGTILQAHELPVV